ncbi:MAG: polyribitolphosphotransferase [Clostridiales bacterium]|nr:polyribitolphosphotransferase [Clostridiales bacterium]
MSIIINIGKAMLNFIYCFFKLIPVKKKITIISRQSDSPSLDITMLAEKIKELHPDYEVTILCKTLGHNLFGKIFYVLHMFSQMYHLTSSEAVLLDSYCILASILNHRKTLFIIQMWHSIGTMKKFAYSILDKPEGNSSKIAHLMKMHANYDYILAAGDGYHSHLAEGFNYSEDKIVTMPLPRVEALKSYEYSEKARAEILLHYPELKDKKNVVYVPTFRKVGDNAFLEAVANLCHSFDYDNYNLIIKAHPLSDLGKLDSSLAIVDTTFSSFEMLFIADIVISDYSCIMYEAAVLKKPIYLYAYDYNEYMSTRDIYMDYKSEVPGPICNDANSLVDSISSGIYDYEKLDAFLNKYVYMSSNHETEDMVNFIFRHKKTLP